MLAQFGPVYGLARLGGCLHRSELFKLASYNRAGPVSSASVNVVLEVIKGKLVTWACVCYTWAMTGNTGHYFYFLFQRMLYNIND